MAVAISKVGDKTQFLALFLAACFRKPAVIIARIVLALLANHTLAGLAGVWVRRAVAPNSLRIALGLYISAGLFAAFAVLILIEGAVRI